MSDSSDLFRCSVDFNDCTRNHNTTNRTNALPRINRELQCHCNRNKPHIPMAQGNRQFNRWWEHFWGDNCNFEHQSNNFVGCRSELQRRRFRNLSCSSDFFGCGVDLNDCTRNHNTTNRTNALPRINRELQCHCNRNKPHIPMAQGNRQFNRWWEHFWGDNCNFEHQSNNFVGCRSELQRRCFRNLSCSSDFFGCGVDFNDCTRNHNTTN